MGTHEEREEALREFANGLKFRAVDLNDDSEDQALFEECDKYIAAVLLAIGQYSDHIVATHTIDTSAAVGEGTNQDGFVGEHLMALQDDDHRFPDAELFLVRHPNGITFAYGSKGATSQSSDSALTSYKQDPEAWQFAHFGQLSIRLETVLRNLESLHQRKERRLQCETVRKMTSGTHPLWSRPRTKLAGDGQEMVPYPSDDPELYGDTKRDENPKPSDGLCL